MRCKLVIVLLLCLAALFTAVSCKSTPPPPPPQAQVPDSSAPLPSGDDGPPDQALINGLNAAIERANAARKLDMDFDAPTLFPPDWQSADSLFSQAEQMKSSSTIRDTRDSTARYTRAAEALEALADKTLAKNYQDMEEQLTYVRNNIIAAHGQELIPDLLLDADNVTADADAKYQAKDYYAAKDSAQNALQMYTVLKVGLDAYAVREQITGRGFEVYDPLNIEQADAILQSAASDYSSKNISAANDKVDESLLRYNLALQTAWESYAAEKGAASSTERQNALNYRANVAVRQEYNEAQAIHTRANTAFQAARHEEAATLFEESESMFEVIAQVAQEKQRAAQAALNRASQKMSESDEAARRAEVILEGGAR